MFDVKSFDVDMYDKIIGRGLSTGVGRRDGQMCIEAAICTVLGLDHGDDPQCVAASVRSFKINLNDSRWSSAEARAAGLRDLGLAQLGSLGVVDDRDFERMMAEQTTRILIPQLFRKVFAGRPDCIAAVDRCEREGTQESAARAARAARAAGAAGAAWAAGAAGAARAAGAAEAAEAAGAAEAAWAAEAARAAGAAGAAWAAWAAGAARAARAAGAADPDYYLKLSASFALAALRGLKSPGCALLEKSLA